MSKLSKEVTTELLSKGRELSPCAHISERGISPILIENVMCFMAKRPLIKVGMAEVKPADRKKLAASLSSSTDSIIIELSGTSLLLYRTPIFAS